MGWLLVGDSVIGFHAAGFRSEISCFDPPDDCYPWDCYGVKYNGDQIVQQKLGKVIRWNGIYTLLLDSGIFIRIREEAVEIMEDYCIGRIIRIFGINDILASKQMPTISIHTISGYFSIPKGEFFMAPKFMMRVFNVNSNHDLFHYLDESFRITDIVKVGDFMTTLFEKEMQWRKI